MAGLVGAASLIAVALDPGAAAGLRPQVAVPLVRPNRTQPNIVLISIDALAASHLMPYGASRATSPEIAAFATRSIVFERFHASSNFTTPSVSSMLTGREPWTHRAIQLAGRPTGEAIAESLPARLQGAGYSSAAFSGTPWAGGRRLGFGPYFERAETNALWTEPLCSDRLSGRLRYLCPAYFNLWISYLSAAAIHLLNAAHLIDAIDTSDPGRTVTAAEEWLKLPHAGPVFLWVHLWRPHDPYAAPAPWLGQFDRSANARDFLGSAPQYQFAAARESEVRLRALESRYDESIAYVDHVIGQLLADVQARIGPNTAIFLTADHGESFRHGYGAHGGVMQYEDLLHIPLIVALPQEQLAGTRSDALASQIDLAPTIAAVAGIDPSPAWTGRSLFSHGKGEGSGRAIFAMNFEQSSSHGKLTTGSIAILQGNWKLVRFVGQPKYLDMPRLETELFDIAADPGELRNLASSRPEVVANLSATLLAELGRNDGPIGP